MARSRNQPKTLFAPSSNVHSPLIVILVVYREREHSRPFQTHLLLPL
jgi:hypothetical protein